LLLACLVRKGHSFLNAAHTTALHFPRQLASVVATSNRRNAAVAMALSSSSAAATTDNTVLSWPDLQKRVGQTVVGKALNDEAELRVAGKGSAHVQNKLRMFASDEEPQITLFRDHAGW
jgi:hypothetical protein